MKKELVIFNPSIEDGGVEKNLFIISNYLCKKISEISIISSDIKKKKYFSDKINFISPIFFHSSGGRKIKYFFCIILLIIKIIRNRNLLVFSFQANIYAIIVCYLFNINIISRSNTSASGWSKNYLKYRLFNFFLKKTKKVIVNSIDFKKEIDNKFKIKSALILNPFDFKKIKKLSKKKIKERIFKSDFIKIINIGRMTDQKDQLTLLKAFVIARKIRKISLIILGKGKNYNLLKKFIEINNIRKYVHLLGYKDNPFPYIKLSDVFILTSKFEGSPNVLIEAQFLRKYIISSKCPTGPREILDNGNNGDLFRVGDYKELANLIINYKKNNKKISRGYLSAKKYDLDKNCLKYYNLISKYL